MTGIIINIGGIDILKYIYIGHTITLQSHHEEQLPYLIVGQELVGGRLGQGGPGEIGHQQQVSEVLLKAADGDEQCSQD